MNRKLFGTDGIRGQSNKYPILASTAMQIGMATAKFFVNGEHRHRVVIGKDTRLSGYMIEPALVSGFVAMGMDVTLLGPLPTPAIAMLTKSLRADIGVMISASHNEYFDNGIKIFDPNGIKLSDEIEIQIEELINSDLTPYLAKPADLGRVQRLEDQFGRYIEFIKHAFPKNLTLSGLKIVLDCANGAAYKVAPKVFWELGAEVIAFGVEPDGFNINKNCGSTYPELIQKKVIEHKADIGIALDGDSDRVIICDETGKIIDGDQILALIALHYKENNILNGDTVVATQMSSISFEKFLKSHDINLIRTKVGDRYVAKEMRRHDYRVGGEKSGHIILRDLTTTGDGLLASIKILSRMVIKQCKASDALNLFKPLPQIIKNYRYVNQSPLKQQKIINYIKQIEQDIENYGRLIVRESGTEPLIRVMVEGSKEERNIQYADDIIDFIHKESCV